MIDILETLFELHPYSQQILNCIVFGDKNIGVMLEDGRIGVCSTLCHKFNSKTNILANPDFSAYDHRVIVNAWVNANANYLETSQGSDDIFDAIDFTSFKRVSMVGYFGSLTQKLIGQGVNLMVFDLDENEKPVEPLENLGDALNRSDAVILTATSISNCTFNDLYQCISSRAKVYILGPSTPLSSSLFFLPNITGLFGARFQTFDTEVLNAIERGGGTRSFLGRMEKVYMLKP